MRLLYLADGMSPVLELMSAAFEAEPGEQTITFIEKSDHGQLMWEEKHGGRTLSVHMAIPLAWLADPARTEDITSIARNVARTVAAEIEHSMSHPNSNGESPGVPGEGEEALQAAGNGDGHSAMTNFDGRFLRKGF